MCSIKKIGRSSVFKVIDLILYLIKKVMRQVKLIWDFRGQSSKKTAQHHEIHLKEFILSEKMELNITGFEVLNEMHSIAYMVVTDQNMIVVRDALKPHRGELFL